MSTEDNNNQNTENHRRAHYRLVRHKKVSTSYNKFINLSIVIFPVSIILILLISGGFFEDMFNGGGSNNPTIPTDPTDPTDPPTEPYHSDITLTTIYGQTIQLANHQGKVVIIFFFGTHCAGCPEQAGILADIDNNFNSNQLFIVPISLDTTAETSNSALDGWLDGYNPNWPVIRDNVQYTYASYFNIGYKPTVSILDTNGNIEATMVGITQGSFNNIKTEVDALL